MDIGSQRLSEVVTFGKYAKHIKELSRREVYKEIVDRNKQMHLQKFPDLSHEIEAAYAFVYRKEVLPSMRSMQFGGEAIQKKNARIYNCSFQPVDSIYSFSEIMYLLLCGCGCGYSVKRKDVAKLPPVKPTHEEVDFTTYVVEDSIEGWAEVVRFVMSVYLLGGFDGKVVGRFKIDYSQISPKGTRLSSGGLCPGYKPLKEAVDHVIEILDKVEPGRRLAPLECHDIICHLSNAVVSGGIRRSAMIALFDLEDEEMLNCKDWRVLGDNEQRYRANNSAVIRRDGITKEQFIGPDGLWWKIKDSMSGEPGIFWTNDPEWGTNPCAEIALRPYQFCNLCEINAATIRDQIDLNNRVWAASFIGTLQASYTNFSYLRPIWRETTERDALLGIGMTGIASGIVMYLDLKEAAAIAVNTNRLVAGFIGINPAARITTVKPSGTTSTVLACSSGVHAWESKYLIRRIRLGVDEPIAIYLMEKYPSLWEWSKEKSKADSEIVFSFPIKAPEGAITKDDEDALTLLERVKKLSTDWIMPGHIHGENTHNVSCTVYVKDHEWQEVGEWLWENRDHYTGMSCYPFFDAVYEQAPFEAISEAQYVEMVKHFEGVEFDLRNVYEPDDMIDHARDSAACAGGSCEVTRF
jgi:ribonucleoside-triphosphate reductase (thioredoxin)